MFEHVDLPLPVFWAKTAFPCCFWLVSEEATARCCRAGCGSVRRRMYCGARASQCSIVLLGGVWTFHAQDTDLCLFATPHSLYLSTPANVAKSLFRSSNQKYGVPAFSPLTSPLLTTALAVNGHLQDNSCGLRSLDKGTASAVKPCCCVRKVGYRAESCTSKAARTRVTAVDHAWM